MQETACTAPPGQTCDLWFPTLRPRRVARHTRHRVRRLNAVDEQAPLSRFGKPRNRNLWACCCSLIIPKTGSTSCILCRYARLASCVDIHTRWRRNAASSPTSSARPCRLPIGTLARQPPPMPGLTRIMCRERLMRVSALWFEQRLSLSLTTGLYGLKRPVLRLGHHHPSASCGALFQVAP